MPGVEVWGGVECTVNRVGNEYFDQLEWSGHADRIEDLDLFYELGIRTIRYPILWERIAPKGLSQADWTWADQRLERLRELGIRPIVGLVHHGSGPLSTSLLDPAFPEKLAEFAGMVAQRYPWVDAYTPVNEPLTTARFSCLYGLWYPHAADENSFTRALLNEVRATKLAMRAIRRVNSQALLVQTEDLAKTFSTPCLEYQADFDNSRRWLSLDLLAGRITKDYPLYDYLGWAGISEKELLVAAEEACLPDIIGFNYYITGERFLDERFERYPEFSHGGNGRQRYADVEAVRACTEGPAGVGRLLEEAWERYRRPLAITEVHLGATRDEQLRWLWEVWNDANRLCKRGIDIRAITAWALLGSFNWNTLATRDERHYEPGVFDVRSSPPRPTALAKAIKSLAMYGTFDHPALDTPGWWRRPERLLYPPSPRRDRSLVHIQPSGGELEIPLGLEFYPMVDPSPRRAQSPRQILITGAKGTLGRAFVRLCEERGLPYQALAREELDISDPDQVERAVAQPSLWAVINTAGYVRVDDAEREPDLCRQINLVGAALLADACQRGGKAFLTFSSDLVFDGTQSTPYLESSLTNPLNVYGRSKAASEASVLNSYPESLIIRTSAFFGPWDQANFAAQTLYALLAGREVTAAEDVLISPTYVPDLVHTSLDLLEDGEQGIWHLANQGQLSWLEFACLITEAVGADASRIRGISGDEMGWAAPRPRNSVLGSERGKIMPTLENAVRRYANSF